MRFQTAGIVSNLHSRSQRHFLANPARPGRVRGHCGRIKTRYAALIRRSRIRDRIYFAEELSLNQ
jgi:hypothetical protein